MVMARFSTGSFGRPRRYYYLLFVGKTPAIFSAQYFRYRRTKMYVRFVVKLPFAFVLPGWEGGEERLD